MGSLEYLLPIEYVETMKLLHNQAPQSELHDLHRVFEEDLGQKASVSCKESSNVLFNTEDSNYKLCVQICI